MDYLAILGAAVVTFILGWLWHGPLFGKVWVKLSNITPEQIEKGKADMKSGKMLKSMILALIFCIITAAVLNKFMMMLGVSTYAGALSLAFFIWFGFQLTLLANGYLWEGKSAKLFSFNFVYQFVFLAAQSFLLVALA